MWICGHGCGRRADIRVRPYNLALRAVMHALAYPSVQNQSFTSRHVR